MCAKNWYINFNFAGGSCNEIAASEVQRKGDDSKIGEHPTSRRFHASINIKR
jgi:hypothetical protein